jgi:hypothetical protein
MERKILRVGSSENNLRLSLTNALLAHPHLRRRHLSNNPLLISSAILGLITLGFVNHRQIIGLL